jgi:hypothetical protein
MKDDPIVKEVREAGQKLFERSGGTTRSFVEMLIREQAKENRPVFQKTPCSSHAGKAKRQ